jgi:hypothetical protein
VRLLDLIDIHRYKHEEAVCFLVLSGPYAGTISPTWSGNCFAVTIKDRKVTAKQVEFMLTEFRAIGCLKPAPHGLISGEHFLKLSVDIDANGVIRVDCGEPAASHG